MNSHGDVKVKVNLRLRKTAVLYGGQLEDDEFGPDEVRSVVTELAQQFMQPV